MLVEASPGALGANAYAKQLVRYVHLNPVRPADKGGQAGGVAGGSAGGVGGIPLEQPPGVRGHGGRGRGAEAVAEKVRELASAEADKRLRVWLRVRLRGEPMTEVARAEGYRDGSGVARAAERLEAKAMRDTDLARRLANLQREFSGPADGNPSSAYG